LGLEDRRRVEFATAPMAITRLMLKLTQSNLSLFSSLSPILLKIILKSFLKIKINYVFEK